MIPMFQSLWAHLTWADDAILKAVSEQEGAYAEEDIRKLLHHAVWVERFFLALCQHRPFDMEAAKLVPGEIEGMRRLFAEAHADGVAYLAHVDDAELAHTIEFPVPAFKDFRPPVRDGLMQVIMHSEHHRGQVAMHLRELGGKPPVLDYIMWVRTIR